MKIFSTPSAPAVAAGFDMAVGAHALLKRASLAILVLCAAGLMVQPAHAQFTWKNTTSGLCIAVNGGVSYIRNDSPLITWNCIANDASQIFTTVNGLIHIGSTNFCVATYDNPPHPGSRVGVWQCQPGDPTQTFQRGVAADIQINVAPGPTNNNSRQLCFGAKDGSSSPGAAIILWYCDGSASQSWQAPAVQAPLSLSYTSSRTISFYYPSTNPPGRGQLTTGAALVASGAGNFDSYGLLRGRDGKALLIDFKVISNDGGSLVASGAGNLVASGAGNLVASGAGNLVASGAGNLVGNSGGTLVASGAGNITMYTPESVAKVFPIMVNNGANIATNNGANIATNNGANLVGYDPTRTLMSVDGNPSADTYVLASVSPASSSWPLSSRQSIYFTSSGKHTGVPHNIALSLVTPKQTWALTAVPPATSVTSTTTVTVNLPASSTGYIVAKDMTTGKTVNSQSINFVGPAPAAATYQLTGVVPDAGPWIPGTAHRVTWSATGAPAAGQTVTAYFQAATQLYTLCQNIPAAQGSCTFNANLPVGAGIVKVEDSVSRRPVSPSYQTQIAAAQGFKLTGVTASSNAWTVGNYTVRLSWTATGIAAQNETVSLWLKTTATPQIPTGTVRLASGPASRGYYDYQGIPAGLRNVNGQLYIKDDLTGANIAGSLIQIR